MKTSTLLQQLISQHKPHIVAATETWLNPEKAPPTFRQYTIASRADRLDNRDGRGGGVIIYAHKKLKATPITVPGLQQARSQVCGIRIEDFTFLVVYKSPNQSITEDRNLYNELSEINHDAACYVGDFNARFAYGAREPYDDTAEALHEYVEAAGLHQHVEEPTRQGRILDLVLTTSPDLLQHPPDVFPVQPLDHKALMFEVKVPAPEPVVDIVTYDHKKLDWKVINREVQILLSQVKPVISSHREAEEYSEILHGTIKQVVETHLEATKKIRQVRPGQPFVNSTIIALQNAVSKLYKLAKRHNNEAAWNKYNETVLKLNREVQRQQVWYESSLIRDYAANPSKFHQYLRRNSKPEGRIGPLTTANGVVTEDGDIADVLIDHYAGVSEPPQLYTGSYARHSKTMPKLWITTKMVKNKIMALPKAKAPGPDQIRNGYLKSLSDTIAPYLATLFNYCLHQGYCLSHWHEVWITPIPKAGKPPDQASSQRPVSLLQQTWKLFESIVLDYWVAQMRRTGYMSKFQHASRKGASPVTNILQYLKNVTDNVEDKVVTHMASFDLSCAFDKASFRSLVQSCLDSGMDPEFAKIINNLLVNRKIRVKVQDSLSKAVTFTSGVPQGSCSSSHIFCSMVQGVLPGLKCNYALYCDDIKLYKACRTPQDLRDFQKDIDHFHAWMAERGLAVNTSKSYHQIFNFDAKNPVSFARFGIGRKRLKLFSQQVDLGVVIDDHLQFHDQMVKIVIGVRKRALQAKKMLLSRDPKLLTAVWNTYVSPPAEYGVGVFALDEPKADGDGQPGGITAIQRELCRIQRKFFKNVPFDSTCPGPPGIIRKMRHLKLGLVWSILHGKTVLEPQEVFRLPARQGLRTEDNLNIVMPRVTTNAKRRYLGTAAVKQWNLIPSDKKTALSKAAFKKFLRYEYPATKFNYELNSDTRFNYENQM